jgi:acetoin utilization deacetylase AcuC-like enzyme
MSWPITTVAAVRRTGYVWHDMFGWHDTGTHAAILPAGYAIQPHHNLESAESKARLASLVEVSGLLDELVRVRPRTATIEDLCRVHTHEYVHRIEHLSATGGGDGGDGMTPFGTGAFEIAQLAAGGTIAAVDAVLSGEVDNAYALVRPPGHHATRESGMGYCLFSNVSVAIEWARANHGVHRVAIVDYDVHHGNGAQGIYYRDPDTLAISIHQEDLFPRRSGPVNETGDGAGVGHTINIPLPAGCGNDAYVTAIERAVRPALERFQPELIMVSSGFDACAADPLGRMSVTASGYRRMAEVLVEIAAEVARGRIVFSHEGGYSPAYVPFCGLAVLEALSGATTSVGDPFEAAFEEAPTHSLKQWQAAVIEQAREIALALQLEVV